MTGKTRNEIEPIQLTSFALWCIQATRHENLIKRASYDWQRSMRGDSLKETNRFVHSTQIARKTFHWNSHQGLLLELLIKPRQCGTSTGNAIRIAIGAPNAGDFMEN